MKCSVTLLSCSDARAELRAALRAAPAAPGRSPPPAQGSFIRQHADNRAAKLLGREQSQAGGRDRIRAGLRACDR